jgi:hypothetical protein
VFAPTFSEIVLWTAGVLSPADPNVKPELGTYAAAYEQEMSVPGDVRPAKNSISRDGVFFRNPNTSSLRNPNTRWRRS